MATGPSLDQMLTHLQRWTPVCAEAAMAETTRWMADYAKAHHPFQNRTTNLEHSIAGGVTEADARHVTGALSAGYPAYGTSDLYAGFVELGTSRSRPYPYLWPTMLAAQQQRIFEEAFAA